MRKIILPALLSISMYSFAQDAVVNPGTYSWPSGSAGLSSTVISGSGHDLSKVVVTGNTLESRKKKKVKVPDQEEQLILVKSGVLTIILHDSTYSLSKGSIAMIMPGDGYVLQNMTKTAVAFHLMKYQSKLPVDAARGKNAGGSFVKDWNKLQFNPHDRGGVRPYFNRATAMTKRFEMHVTTLNEGITSHPPHTHGAEEIILVLDGNVDMLIGEKNYKGKPGDLLFVTSNIPHSLKNDGAGQCTYFAFQWE